MPTTQVLFRDASLQFHPGNCYGVVGANGSGKSTLLRVLTGEELPTEGTVAIPKRLRMGVLSHARPVMEDLCRRCNEAVYLAIRRGSEFLFIDLVESAQQVKVAPLVGKRYPLTGAAPGQVLLAFTDDPDMPALVSTTSGIRRIGYHYEQGGLGEMVSCLAAPFFNNLGSIAGALCVVGPAFRMSESQVDAMFWPFLKDASEVISSRLGYFKPYSGSVRL